MKLLPILLTTGCFGDGLSTPEAVVGCVAIIGACRVLGKILS